MTGPATSGTDALDAIDKAAAVVEDTGLIPNGIAAGSKIGSALRNAYREIGAPPATVPDETIYDMSVARSPAWDDTQGTRSSAIRRNCLSGFGRTFRSTSRIRRR